MLIRLKLHFIDLIGSLHQPHGPGILGEHLSHTSHDRLSKMENKKPRAANCDIGCRGKKLNESLAFFKYLSTSPCSVEQFFQSREENKVFRCLSKYYCVKSLSLSPTHKDTPLTHPSYYNHCYPTLKASATIVCINKTTVFQLIFHISNNMVKMTACDFTNATISSNTTAKTQTSTPTNHILLNVPSKNE